MFSYQKNEWHNITYGLIKNNNLKMTIAYQLFLRIKIKLML